MRAGEMKHRVQVYRPTGAKDEFGEAELGLWNANVWCAVMDMDASEQILGGENSAGVYVRFKTRYSRAIEMEYPDMVFIFRGREFQITGVRNKGFQDKELVVTGVHYANQQRVRL